MNIRFENRLRKMLQESTGKEKVKKLLNEALAGDENACRTAYQDNEKFTLACVYGCIPSTGAYDPDFLIPNQQKQPVVIANAKQPVTSGGVTYKQVVISQPLTDGSMYVYMVADDRQNFMQYNDQGQTKMWYAKKACGDLIASVNPQLSTDAKRMIDLVVGAGGQVKSFGDCLADKTSLSQGWKAMKISDYMASDTFKGVPEFAALATQFDKQRNSPAMICVKGAEFQIQGDRTSEDKKAYLESYGYKDGRCPVTEEAFCHEVDLSDCTKNTAMSPDGKTPWCKQYTAGTNYVHQTLSGVGATRAENLKKNAELINGGSATPEACKQYLKDYVDAYDSKTQLNSRLMVQYKQAVDTCTNERKGKGFKVLGLFNSPLQKKLEAMQYNARVTSRLGNTTDYSLSLNSGSTTLARESIKDRELKNLIRESLLDVKRTKKKIGLGENKIIKNRFNILSENRIIKTKSQKQKMIQELFVETAYLNSQGYDTYLINETFLDTLKGLFGTAADSTLQYFKEQIAKWLIEKLTPMDPNGWMANIIISAVGNVPVGEITRLTECNYLSDVLTKSIVEGAINKYKNEAGMEGAFYDILRNGIVEMLEDTKFGQTVESAIGKLVCPLLGGVAEKMQGMGDSMKKGALSLV
ncbi:MAG: hypothetical protein RLZ10_247 [Bacteroidota bacterium]|jgi:hypothetical protein